VSLRVGIIGYGLAGRLFHAPFITCTPGLVLTHVVTRSAERAAQVAQDLPGVAVVAGVDALLAADVELVVVASPSALHASHTRAALQVDKHVVVDKPAARDAGQFADLVALAEARDRRLVVFHNRRWDSDYLTLRQILAEQPLGTIHRFETRMERWRPVGKGGWRESPDPADLGGLRYDLGPHLVDQALQLFGPVSAVQASSRSLREVGSHDDDVLATLTHASGVTTVVSASLLAALPGPRLRVLGTAGAAVLAHTDSQEDRLRAGERPGTSGRGWGAQPGWFAQVALGEAPEILEIPYRDGRWPEFYAGVRDCLVGAGPVPVSPDSALATMYVLDAIGQAVVTGRTIEPPHGKAPEDE
jgi:predicted dehydrogenase